MKAVILASLLAALSFLPACSKQQPTQNSPGTNTASSGTSPVDAPGGYLQAIAKGQQSAVKTIDTTSINKAIELFNVDQGRNPRDLNELVEKKYLPQIPTPPFGTKLVYDANAGTVKVEKQ